MDAAFAVHPDMKSHTGGVISFGRGGLACKSTKQKLNTKSSTEAEFVGASDYLPNSIWVQNFLAAQGYDMSTSHLEQDNQSAIKLAINGRRSAGPKSRHIAIRYFWIRDRLRSERITVRHCPTLAMLADFFTKPLQGHLFFKFRDALLGYTSVVSLAAALPAPIEERVGSSIRTGTVHRTVAATNTASTSGSSTTWADIAKRTPHNSTLAAMTAVPVVRQPQSCIEGCRSATSSKLASTRVERSFSRNTPVN